MMRLKFKMFNRSLRSLVRAVQFEQLKQLEQLKRPKGFTLIELLVVVSLIGLILAFSLVALQGTRAQARDAKRKADLEEIRSGLEIYRTDCGTYPTTLTFGGKLAGDGSSTACATTNTYISAIPQDPSPSYNYNYAGSTSTYTLCAYLEQGTGSVTGCGSCAGAACNYKVTNP